VLLPQLLDLLLRVLHDLVLDLQVLDGLAEVLEVPAEA